MAMTLVLEEAALEKLGEELRGQVIAPGDAEYDAARTLHNAMIDKRPAVIARCTGVADVRAALDFGVQQGVEIAVKSGGHNVAGKALCDDGLVIDLSPMKGIRVDPQNRTVRAQPGLTWGEFDRETQLFGLATTGGAVSTTGIAGLTLGGGLGWLQRKHGLTCDNLISADVVTADGRLLTASETENADLFWGLRGGGGNFGIVTSLEYRLHPLGPVLGGPMLYPIEAAREVFDFHREFSAQAPDELFCEFGLAPLPDGRPGAFLFLFHAGPPEQGERDVRPARELRRPLEDFLDVHSYCDVQQMFDADLAPGLLNYWKSSDLAELSDGVIETMLEFYAKAPSPGAMVVVDQYGGAVARVPADATAFGHRHAAYDVVIVTLWSDPTLTEPHVEWARGLWAALQPYAQDSVYVNYLGDEGEERIRAAYGEHYARLSALKRSYDPDNVFRNNQNIEPA
ncbi:MAG: FAD-binding oxidoreductase [Gaiellaceae bacterium]